MPPVEQHGRPPVGRRELQSAGRGLVGRLYLGDHAGQRPVAQCILGEREDFGILSPLRVENLVRGQSHLFEAGRIKVEPAERPQHRHARTLGKARGKTCGK